MISLPRLRRGRLLGGLLALISLAALPAAEVFRPKVVIVTMFEIGEPKGDRPGELQFWVEREGLDRVITVPAAPHPLHANADASVVALLTGVGNTNAAAAVMALGLDPRFDLRRTYWVVAGIAGVDPADASLGSAAWARYVVEGDLAHEFDAREIPADWPTGYVPLGKRRPYELPRATTRPGQVFTLDSGLVEWAHALTQDTELPDSEGLRSLRSRYDGIPAATRAPFVLIGDAMASSTFWHGSRMNTWANEWMRYYTDGKANYVMTAMEDTGTLRALELLGQAGRCDRRRALVLRTASNYDSPWPGASAVESLNSETPGTFSGLIPSLEAAYRVGSRVVRELVAGWERYEATVPGSR
jgi:purine nucleoside permease